MKRGKDTYSKLKFLFTRLESLNSYFTTSYCAIDGLVARETSDKFTSTIRFFDNKLLLKQSKNRLDFACQLKHVYDASDLIFFSKLLEKFHGYEILYTYREQNESSVYLTLARRWSIQRVVYIVGNVQPEAPIVSAIFKQVENRHRTVREAMNKHRF